MANEEKYDMPADTAKLYQLAPGAPPVFVSKKHGHIDVRKLTPAKAAKLVADKVPHIIAKDPVAPVSKSSI